MDRNEVKKIIRKNGVELRNYPAYNNDQEIVLLSISQHGENFQYASQELKNNKDFILKILDDEVCNICFIEQIGDKLRKDKEITLKAVVLDAIAFAYVKEWRDDKEAILIALCSAKYNSDMAFSGANDEIRNEIIECKIEFKFANHKITAQHMLNEFRALQEKDKINQTINLSESDYKRIKL